MKLQPNDQFDGIVFIPHPYITQSRPGRRLDDNFLEATLSKLDAALAIAKESNYLPIILNGIGANSSEHKILSPVFRRLAMEKVIIHAGHNEYKKSKIMGKYLDPNSTSALLSSAHISEVLSHDEKYSSGITVNIAGKKVAIADLLSDGSRLESVPSSYSNADSVIMLGNLAITGDMDESVGGANHVEGVDLVVNSFAHKRYGINNNTDTPWLFPGTLARISFALRDQTPGVWKWSPNQELSFIEVPHTEHIFETSAAEIAEHASNQVKDESDFVQMLSDEVKLRKGTQETDDDCILDVFNEVFDTEDIDPKTQSAILDLHKSVLSQTGI